MPLNAIDYSKTLIYKIVCKDLSIPNTYAGHTTSFKDRKGQHKSKSKNGKEKVYQIIRENGGWDNWEMIEIEKYPCKDLREAQTRERYWYEKLNANLNTYRPMSSKEEQQKWYEENKEKHNEMGKQNYIKNKEHISQKHKEWRENNKEKEKELHKKNYEKNKEELKIKRAVPYQCQCGSVFRIASISIHNKSLKHQNWINIICDAI